MRILKISTIFFLCLSVALVSGCNEVKDLRVKNNTQRERIEQLEAELAAGTLKLAQLKSKLAEGGIEEDTLKAQVAALEEDLAKKNELLASMQTIIKKRSVVR